MPDTFAPQLALFVAGRPELALYRDFVFPSVPARTGLLAAGIDDIRASRSEIAPMAIDIALRKAAVVVYDSGPRSRLPLDYIRRVRGRRPVVTVDAPDRSRAVPAVASEDHAAVLVRPAEMSDWAEHFVELLVSRISALPLRPAPGEVGTQLRTLTQQQRFPDLLLTCLALLEHDLRREDLPTAVPSNPSGGVMARLRDHFGSDYQTVIDAVSLRHDLIQHPPVDDEASMPIRDGEDAFERTGRGCMRISMALAEVVRRRYGVPIDPDDPAPGSGP